MEEYDKMLDCIGQISEMTGASYAEAEEIVREQTGYTGKRFFGENGLAN